jgi:hypothetical protein
VKGYLDSIALFATPDSAFQTAFGTTIAEADGRWLAHAKSAGQIPQATGWVNLRPNFVVTALSLLPFALFMIAAVWLIRQVLLIARFLTLRVIATTPPSIPNSWPPNS